MSGEPRADHFPRCSGAGVSDGHSSAEKLGEHGLQDKPHLVQSGDNRIGNDPRLVDVEEPEAGGGRTPINSRLVELFRDRQNSVVGFAPICSLVWFHVISCLQRYELIYILC